MLKKCYLWSLIVAFGLIGAGILGIYSKSEGPSSQGEIAFTKGLECFERHAWLRSQHYMQEAFDCNHPKAGYYLAISLRSLSLLSNDQENRFVALMQPLAEQKHIEAARELGLYYFDKDEREKALYWLEKASALGDNIATCRLGCDRLEANSYQTDCEGLKAIEQAAEDSPMLLYQLGLARLKCDPENLDFLEAFVRSAQQGFFPAQEHLGRLYFYPNPWVSKNLELSKQWLTQAASAGYPPAMYQLGLWHFSEDYHDDMALQWLERAALKGHKEAQYFMGRHCEVLRTPQKESILSWYEKAANKQSVSAFNRLGILYTQGVYGVPIDYLKSHSYFTEAAERGDPAAQNNLGLLYFYKTQDCLESDQKAIEWFEKSAKQGYAAAIHNLTIMRPLIPNE